MVIVAVLWERSLVQPPEEPSTVRLLFEEGWLGAAAAGPTAPAGAELLQDEV